MESPHFLILQVAQEKDVADGSSQSQASDVSRSHFYATRIWANKSQKSQRLRIGWLSPISMW